MKTQVFKPPALSESQIQTAIMNRLQLDGWLVVRVNSGGMKTGNRYFRAYIIQQLNVSAGLPDVIAFREGRFVMIEVKDAKGKLSETQKRFHDFAARFGIQVHVVRDVGGLEGLLYPGAKVPAQKTFLCEWCNKHLEEGETRIGARKQTVSVRRRKITVTSGVRSCATCATDVSDAGLDTAMMAKAYDEYQRQTGDDPRAKRAKA